MVHRMLSDRTSQPDLLTAILRLTQDGVSPAAVASELGASLCDFALAIFGNTDSCDSPTAALRRLCDFQDDFALRRRRLAAILLLDEVVNAPLECATPLDRLRSIELRRRACAQMLRLCAGERLIEPRDEPDHEDQSSSGRGDRPSARNPLFRSPLDGILEPLLSGLMRPLRPKKPRRGRLYDEDLNALDDFARTAIALKVEAASHAAQSEEHRADLGAAADARERERMTLTEARAVRSFTLAPPTVMFLSLEEPTGRSDSADLVRPPPAL